MNGTILYLAIGILLGPLGLRLIDVALPEDARRLEAIAEIALVAGLFCVGLRLQAPLSWRDWRLPLRLAVLGMLATALAVAAIAHVFFGLSFPQSLLLGAILAPIDPLFTTETHLSAAGASDAARTGLAAEGAIGSALALPPLAFALGLLGERDLGLLGTRWLVLDVLWALGAGIAIGWTLGRLASRGLTKLEPDSRDGLSGGLLVAGLMAGSYCVALAVHAQGLVAVLVAALALSHGGRLHGPSPLSRLSPPLLHFARRVERVVTASMALLLGALVMVTDIRPSMFVLALLLLVAVRPLAVSLGFGRQPAAESERSARRWFGVRGIASFYCLMIAVNQGLPTSFMHDLTALVLTTLAISIVLHGIAATPLGSGRLGDASRRTS